MAEIKRVKISHVIKSQIPEFLNQESPKFASFLKQYYASQEHKSGVIDLANNLPEYRQISAFNSESLIASTTLTAPIFAASSIAPFAIITPFTEFIAISLLPIALPAIIVPLTAFAAICRAVIAFEATSTDVISLALTEKEPIAAAVSEAASIVLAAIDALVIVLAAIKLSVIAPAAIAAAA